MGLKRFLPSGTHCGACGRTIAGFGFGSGYPYPMKSVLPFDYFKGHDSGESAAFCSKTCARTQLADY
ncbi:hypothetical protein HUU53_04560 [Candidatus Micrarchaeota archaeon]|nr:hypothetical protein [Candidatus Micrarchaeota archaeon]